MKEILSIIVIFCFWFASVFLIHRMENTSQVVDSSEAKTEDSAAVCQTWVKYSYKSTGGMLEVSGVVLRCVDENHTCFILNDSEISCASSPNPVLLP